MIPFKTNIIIPLIPLFIISLLRRQYKLYPYHNIIILIQLNDIVPP